MVSGGRNHTVLLQSDGRAVACGKNDDGNDTSADEEPQLVCFHLEQRGFVNYVLFGI